MKKKLKIKWFNLIISFIFIIAIISVVISSYNIIKWFIDKNEIESINNEINDSTKVSDVDDSNKTEIVNQDKSLDKSNPYWDYIKMKLINVNFSKLKSQNADTKGWIRVEGTNINYPFVQASNNSYYLDHSFYKKYNKAGWVFLDYRNKMDGTDKNTILYAHGRLDKTMFGSLKNILKSNWYKNKNNYIIKMSTEYENTLWQVFSVYHIPVTNDYIQTDFKNDNSYVNLLKKLKKRSAYNFDVSLNSKDKIITLSTCYDNDERVVMHAKLIKKEKR